MKAWLHFKTITHHKIKVGQLCFRIGLYKQGLLHDLSKYSWTEFKTGVHYYQGTYSPNAAERNEKGYSLAWLHHKGRNKHHWEFWVDFTKEGPKPAKMPYRYVEEMFCDRVAASMIYQGKAYDDSYPLKYFQRGQAYYILHPETKKVLAYLLTYLSEHGLDETLALIKTKHGYEDYNEVIR
ncbi:hypothetical protein SG0102_09600 [Intestinibaculum porci]|uniref:Catalase n=1 Tax=Intestinibaculum porci TaxID=2487118 RepID=A0A3G9J5G1_9FIRM|nr:DUF5662 family protein [Intestinibaculum porci]BBH26026.1 hypothetical protein SG0102_09600 [Intestinibaculum porci]